MILLACVVLLGLAVFARVVQGSWFAPAAMMGLYWFLWVAAASAWGHFDPAPSAAWTIVVLVLAWVAGSLSASPTGQAAPRSLRLGSPRRVRRAVWWGSLAGVAAALTVQHVNGVPLSQYTSLGGLFDAGSTLYGQRYGGNLRLPIWVSLLLACTYAAALLAPFAARTASGLAGRVGWMLAPLLGTTAYSVVTTTRDAILTAGVLLAAGWIACHVLLDGKLPRLSLRVLLGGVVAVAAAIGAFLLIGFIRIGSQDPGLWPLFLGKLRLYLFGFLPAFNHWLSTAPAYPQAWGTASFAGVAKYLGGNPAYSAAWPDFARIGWQQSTNIFSALRSLVVDFGVVGAPVAMFVGGFFLTRVWRRVTLAGRPVGVTILAAGYAWLLLANTVGFFTFTNTCAAIVLAWLVLRRVVTAEDEAAEPTPAPEPLLRTVRN